MKEKFINKQLAKENKNYKKKHYSADYRKNYFKIRVSLLSYCFTIIHTEHFRQLGLVRDILYFNCDSSNYCYSIFGISRGSF